MSNPNDDGITSINTPMGTTSRPYSVITEGQIDHLAELWDSGEIKHSGKNPDLIKQALGLNFSSERTPYPYGGLDLRKWSTDGHLLVVKPPAFYLQYNQIPTPSNLLIMAEAKPRTVFCMKPAVLALKRIAEAQEVEMYQDLHAEELTFLFRINDGKSPKSY